LRASWSGGYLDQRVPGLTVGPVAVPASHAQMYRSAAFVSYSQPLWKNLGGVLNTVDFELAGAAVEIAELQATENQEAFLLDIAARFVDWAVLVEEARVSGERLMLAEAQLSQTQKQRRANLVGRADVLRAVDAVQEARQTVYLVESRVAATREELAVLTGLVDLGGRAPAIDLYATTPLDGITSVTESARLVRVLDATARQVGIRTAAAAEATRPDLLLSAGIGLRRDGDDAAEALGLKKPDAFVGLTFSLPLGNRSAQAELERTRLERQQVADRMREVTLQLDATLRSLRIQLEQLEHVLQLNTQQIESATKKTREELRLYSQGRGQLTFVIASRDDVQRAKLNYARNAGAYQQLLLRYREVVDQLLPADGDAHGGRR
jgi:outer membrane protein TolC